MNLPKLNAAIKKVDVATLSLVADIFKIRTPKLRKKELAEFLSPLLADNLVNALIYLDEDEYSTFKMIVKEKGSCDRNLINSSNSALVSLLLLDVGYKYVKIPQEIYEAYLKLSPSQRSKINKCVKANTAYLKLTKGLINIYGVLSLNEYSNLLERYLEKIDDKCITRILRFERDEAFYIDEYEEDHYLISFLLKYDEEGELLPNIIDGHEVYAREYLPLDKVLSYAKDGHIEDEEMLNNLIALLNQAKVDEEIIDELTFIVRTLLKVGNVPPYFVMMALEEAGEIPSDGELYKDIVLESLRLYGKTRIFALNGSLIEDMIEYEDFSPLEEMA